MQNRNTNHNQSRTDRAQDPVLSNTCSYPVLDFTASFKRLKEAIIAFNEKLKAEHPKRFRSLSLKSCHMETAKEILRFYGAYLYKNKNNRLDPDRRFWITNGAIAGQKLQHKTTIYRHIERLCEAGIIKEKIWHGSSCGIELKLNPAILAYQEDASEQLLRELESSASEKDESEFQGEELSSETKCNHKDTGYIQELYNINKGGGYVDKFGKGENAAVPAIGQEFYRKQGNLALSVPERQKPEPLNSAVGPDNTGSSWRGVAIGKLTESAWKFAKGLLWKDKNFSSSETELGKKYLGEYFEAIPGQKFLRLANPLFIVFCERILLTKKYLDRNPARYVPPPSTWFNKAFVHGFAGTKHWHKKLRENRKRNKAKHEELKTLISEYQKVMLNPSVSQYRESEQAIRKENQGLLEYFYKCVAQPDKYTGEYLRRYYE